MNPELLKLLEKGYAFQQQGNLDAAEKNYLKVLKREQRNEFALNLMGVVCVRKERFQDAIRYLQDAVAVNANDPETHNNLGLAYKGLNEFSAAQEAFNRSLLLNPKQAATQNNLGNVLASVDQHEQAIRCFELALSIDRNYVDCLNNLSVSLKEVGRLEHALQVIEHAIKIDDERSLSLINKGEVLLQMTQYEEARVAFERAIKIDGNIVAKLNLSTALKQLGKENDALEMLQHVLSIEENNVEALNHIGVLQEQLGDMDEAARYFRLALKSVPNHASSWFQLSKLKDQRLTDEDLDSIRAIIGDPKTLQVFCSSLYFALAWEYEKRKEFAASIVCFKKAQGVKANRNPYRETEMAAYIAESKRCFPVSEIRQSEKARPTPIFIVGMPRSGTTLTEQIIASHSEITGAGELGFITDMTKRMSEMTKQPFPRSIDRLTSENVVALRNAYLSRIVERYAENRFVVDKNPLNFNFVGLIATVFPEARVIYCKRDPMDNCLSIFRLPFDDNQGYSHDLSALGHFYRQHEVLMEYWVRCYGDRILTVQYEDTVDDLERQARRMLEFIGVEFEAEVERFYDNERIVMTPSAEQVRQPIYKTSIDAWKRYGSALDPLAAALKENSND